MAFIQIVEFSTSRVDEMRQRSEQYRADTEGTRTARRATLCKNRDHEGRYMIVAEFDSYEEAMQNSELPETQAMAEDMAKLADGPPTFYNLEVVEVWEG